MTALTNVNNGSRRTSTARRALALHTSRVEFRLAEMSINMTGTLRTRPCHRIFHEHKSLARKRQAQFHTDVIQSAFGASLQKHAHG